MKWLFVIILCLIQQTLSFIYVRHKDEWSYHGSTGPRHWCSLSDNICCGLKQSPLDLRIGKHHLTLKKDQHFSFINYNVSVQSISLENTGHTVMLTCTDKTILPQLFGGLLNKTYTFHSLHFHWGSSDVVGSEHTIESHRYPIELHMVHYSKEFNNFNEAMKSNSTGALAVIGVVYNIGLFNNSQLAIITDNLDSIRYRYEKIDLKSSLQLIKFLPPDTSQFFRYEGSLTSPDCYEVVTWTVFGIPSYISKQQIRKFRRLLESKKGEESPRELSDNFRPVQEENGRQPDLYSNKYIKLN